MRKRISALIIDNKKSEHNYDDVFMKKAVAGSQSRYKFNVREFISLSFVYVAAIQFNIVKYKAVGLL